MIRRHDCDQLVGGYDDLFKVRCLYGGFDEAKIGFTAGKFVEYACAVRDIERDGISGVVAEKSAEPPGQQIFGNRVAGNDA